METRTLLWIFAALAVWWLFLRPASAGLAPYAFGGAVPATPPPSWYPGSDTGIPYPAPAGYHWQYSGLLDDRGPSLVPGDGPTNYTGGGPSIVATVGVQGAFPLINLSF